MYALGSFQNPALKLRLSVQIQVALVGFLKISSNFLTVKQLYSHKESESYNLENAEILVLIPYSTKQSQK